MTTIFLSVFAYTAVVFVAGVIAGRQFSDIINRDRASRSLR
jgi:hypothetical protein